MLNQYGQTDLVSALMKSQPRRGATPLGTGLRLLATGLAQYGQGQQKEEQQSMLADALAGLNRDAGMTDESGAVGPRVGAPAPIDDPQSLAAMMMNPATKDLATVMLSRAMKEPEKPEAYTLSPGQTRFVGGQQVASVPAGPGNRKTVKGADGFQYFMDTGERVLPNVQAKPDPNAGFDQETKLRKEFTASTNDFVKVRDAFGRISASAQDPSAAGDLALVFNFMKVLDPGSVVREGEFATASSAAGVPEQVYGLYNRVLSGERLTPAQRDDFVNRAGRLYESQQKFYSALQDRYSGLATAYDLDPSRVVYDMGAGAPARSVVPEIGITTKDEVTSQAEPLQTQVFSFATPDEVGIADLGSVKDYVSQATEADLEALPPEVYAALEARLRAGQ